MSDRHIATIPVFQPAQVPHPAAEMDSIREVQVECRKWKRTVVCAAARLHVGSLVVLSSCFRAAQCVFQLRITHRPMVWSLRVTSLSQTSGLLDACVSLEAVCCILLCRFNVALCVVLPS